MNFYRTIFLCYLFLRRIIVIIVAFKVTTYHNILYKNGDSFFNNYTFYLVFVSIYYFFKYVLAYYFFNAKKLVSKIGYRQFLPLIFLRSFGYFLDDKVPKEFRWPFIFMFYIPICLISHQIYMYNNWQISLFEWYILPSYVFSVWFFLIDLKFLKQIITVHKIENVEWNCWIDLNYDTIKANWDNKNLALKNFKKTKDLIFIPKSLFLEQEKIEKIFDENQEIKFSSFFLSSFDGRNLIYESLVIYVKNLDLNKLKKLVVYSISNQYDFAFITSKHWIFPNYLGLNKKSPLKFLDPSGPIIFMLSIGCSKKEIALKILLIINELKKDIIKLEIASRTTYDYDYENNNKSDLESAIDSLSISLHQLILRDEIKIFSWLIIRNIKIRNEFKYDFNFLRSLISSLPEFHNYLKNFQKKEYDYLDKYLLFGNFLYKYSDNNISRYFYGVNYFNLRVKNISKQQGLHNQIESIRNKCFASFDYFKLLDLLFFEAPFFYYNETGLIKNEYQERLELENSNDIILEKLRTSQVEIYILITEYILLNFFYDIKYNGILEKRDESKIVNFKFFCYWLKNSNFITSSINQLLKILEKEIDFNNLSESDIAYFKNKKITRLEEYSKDEWDKPVGPSLLRSLKRKIDYHLEIKFFKTIYSFIYKNLKRLLYNDTIFNRYVSTIINEKGRASYVKINTEFDKVVAHELEMIKEADLYPFNPSKFHYNIVKKNQIDLDIGRDKAEVIKEFFSNLGSNFSPAQLEYLSNYFEETEEELTDYGLDLEIDDELDTLFADAAEVIVNHQQGTASLLQRKLHIGYKRTCKIIDQLEATGVVGPHKGSKAREVLIPDLLALEHFLSNLRDKGKI